MNMAAGPLSVSSTTSTNNDGILIGDKVYSEVYLTIDNSLIPEERLSPTPSMLDGLDLHTETDLRILGCELIQSAGILLRLPQVAMATGQVLFHRFFYSKSFVKHSFEIVAMACINLASKIEEAPRRIRDVINVFHHLKQIRVKKTPSSLILDQNYINTKNQVIKAERRILKELGFCVHVKHPHKIIVMYLQVLECEKNQTLVQTAWNYMNDSLRTNVFVRFQAETIACACIFLAARALQAVEAQKEVRLLHTFAGLADSKVLHCLRAIYICSCLKMVTVSRLPWGFWFGRCGILKNLPFVLFTLLTFYHRA
ncbi:cyclin-L1a isoform X2 [Syngnathus typhle]|uniref:cyclin-L1a isoform X2 n=1 Tax=Syngnathus typhle TaxID=161592 RepID=UPI002A6A0CF7|nr:cyclin-L1a isoform X2 [Syngnathus typhle]